MADIQAYSDAHTNLHREGVRLDPVWVSPTVAYIFFLDGDTVPAYVKTTNGGASWSVRTTLGIGTAFKISVWYDRWTPGDTGTKIHVARQDTAFSDIYYRSLDTDGDTLGTERTVFAGASFESGNWSTAMVDITKARGGNLYIGFWGDNDGENGFYRSTDGGANWTSRSNVADGNGVDRILLMPGDAADNQDILCIYWDVTAAFEISRKLYDNSGDSWSETSIAGSMFWNTEYFQMSAAPRHSDNHVILAAWNVTDTSLADLKVWDVASGSITAKTDVITNQAETVGVSVFINQQTDDIYVAYMKGGTWEDTVDVFYKKSTDGGANWGSEQSYSEAAADDVRAVWAGISVGDDGGKFQPMFWNHDLSDLFVNVNNDVDIAAAGVAHIRQGVALGSANVGIY